MSWQKAEENGCIQRSPISGYTLELVISKSSNRIFTIPNVLSFLRLLGVPFFLVLVLIRRDLLAVILLAVSSSTDLLDGQIARRFNQQSKLGEVLDPAADRLYILVIAVALAVRGIVPWSYLIILLGRDLMMLLLVPALRARGAISLPVHFVGKIATFCLLIALPLVLLGAGSWVISPAAKILGWAFAWWGAFMYWWAGLVYVKQTFSFVKETEAS